jgi:hypothetical protein
MNQNISILERVFDHILVLYSNLCSLTGDAENTPHLLLILCTDHSFTRQKNVSCPLYTSNRDRQEQQAVAYLVCMEKMYSEIALLVRKYPLRCTANSKIVFLLCSHIAITHSSWNACSNADFVLAT